MSRATLLNLVADAIEEDEYVWRQSVWVTIPGLIGDAGVWTDPRDVAGVANQHPCGTRACIAGWTVLYSTEDEVNAAWDKIDRSLKEPNSDPSFAWEWQRIGMTLLNLTHDAADLLFEGDLSDRMDADQVVELLRNLSILPDDRVIDEETLYLNGFFAPDDFDDNDDDDCFY